MMKEILGIIFAAGWMVLLFILFALLIWAIIKFIKEF